MAPPNKQPSKRGPGRPPGRRNNNNNNNNNTNDKNNKNSKNQAKSPESPKTRSNRSNYGIELRSHTRRQLRSGTSLPSRVSISLLNDRSSTVTNGSSSCIVATSSCNTTTHSSTATRIPKRVNWHQINRLPELFDANGDRISLTCFGGKRPKKHRPTGATKSGDIVELYFGASQVPSSSSDTKREDSAFICPLCFEQYALRIMPGCPCKKVCCHNCMFAHIETSLARQQLISCPYCRVSMRTLIFNVKPNDAVHRKWTIPYYLPFSPMYRLIRALGLVESENRAVCQPVNPLRRITYAAFLSAILLPGNEDNRGLPRNLDPRFYFRAFVYVHDLKPWNFASHECTLPLPYFPAQAQSQLDRLKDFLTTELSYLCEAFSLIYDEADRPEIVDPLLVRVRELVDQCESVHSYFDMGEQFANKLLAILPDQFTDQKPFAACNIQLTTKMYQESLCFLNSQAQSLDTYCKMVIYSNYHPTAPCTHPSDARLVLKRMRKMAKLNLKKKILQHRRTKLVDQLEEQMVRFEMYLEDGGDEEDDEFERMPIVMPINVTPQSPPPPLEPNEYGINFDTVFGYLTSPHYSPNVEAFVQRAPLPKADDDDEKESSSSSSDSDQSEMEPEPGYIPNATYSQIMSEDKTVPCTTFSIQLYSDSP